MEGEEDDDEVSGEDEVTNVGVFFCCSCRTFGLKMESCLIQPMCSKGGRVRSGWRGRRRRRG